MRVLIVLCLVAATFARQEGCKKNQHYNSCGTACPLTCDNYADPPRSCFLICNPGCHCDEGFVKGNYGSCVLPEECTSEAAALPKTCLGKPDPGMCDAYFPMWYYNVRTGSCHQFVYGGCQGNGNRYATEQECLDQCQDVKLKQHTEDVCDLPAETGPCMAIFRKFYYDKVTKQCKKFVYGGCGGNGNKFNSVSECEGRCGVKKQRRSSADCGAAPDSGACNAYFPRFYYDKFDGRCKKFLYGGCGGNSNNFATEELCYQICKE